MQCYIINNKSACRAGYISSYPVPGVCAQSSQNPLEFLNVYFDGILNPKLFPGKIFWGNHVGYTVQYIAKQASGLNTMYTYLYDSLTFSHFLVHFFHLTLGCHLSLGMIAFARLTGGTLVCHCVPCLCYTKVNPKVMSQVR